jgi:hypothetical protein
MKAAEKKDKKTDSKEATKEACLKRRKESFREMRRKQGKDLSKNRRNKGVADDHR